MKIESQGLFASMKANKTMAFLVIALVGFFIATIFSQVIVQKNNSRDQSYLQMTAELEKQAYRLTSLRAMRQVEMKQRSPSSTRL